jgi:hypothetical protein
MGRNDYGRTPNVWQPAEVPPPFTGHDLGVGPAPTYGPVTTTTVTEYGYPPQIPPTGLPFRWMLVDQAGGMSLPSTVTDVATFRLQRAKASIFWVLEWRGTSDGQGGPGATGIAWDVLLVVNDGSRKSLFAGEVATAGATSDILQHRGETFFEGPVGAARMFMRRYTFTSSSIGFPGIQAAIIALSFYTTSGSRPPDDDTPNLEGREDTIVMTARRNTANGLASISWVKLWALKGSSG